MRTDAPHPVEGASSLSREGDRQVTESFRTMMGAFPSGVAVVTTLDEQGEPRGLTCSSLCSVSMQPPSLLVCVHNRSSTLRAMRTVGAFAVNLLHADSRSVADVFASGAADRFRTVPWTPGDSLAMPHLKDHAHAVAECAVRTAAVHGDHTLVVGEVLGAATAEGRYPLLHGTRKYASWSWPVAPRPPTEPPAR